MSVPNNTTCVCVLSSEGRPLMPTTRCGHARFLIRTQKAKVVERNPFTVQLLYDTADIVQPLYLGTDIGRTNIGLAVADSKGKAVMLVHVTTRNKDIPKLMLKRKESRIQHRHLGRRCVRQRRALKSGTVVKEGILLRLLPGCKTPVQCKHIRNKEAKFNNRKRQEGWLTPTAEHLLRTRDMMADTMDIPIIV